MNVLALFEQVPLVATMSLAAESITDPGINTDFPGAKSVKGWLGGLKFLALSGCLASLFIGGGYWGLATMNGNGSARGRGFAIGGAVGAIIVGLGTEIVNSFASLS